jgi:hypothetical protein
MGQSLGRMEASPRRSQRDFLFDAEFLYSIASRFRIGRGLIVRTDLVATTM